MWYLNHSETTTLVLSADISFVQWVDVTFNKSAAVRGIYPPRRRGEHYYLDSFASGLQIIPKVFGPTCCSGSAKMSQSSFSLLMLLHSDNCWSVEIKAFSGFYQVASHLSVAHFETLSETKEWSWGHRKQMLKNKSNKLSQSEIVCHREEKTELMTWSKFIPRVLMKNIWIWKQERREDEGKGELFLYWHYWPVFRSYYIFALVGFLGTCLPPMH